MKHYVSLLEKGQYVADTDLSPWEGDLVHFEEDDSGHIYLIIAMRFQLGIQRIPIRLYTPEEYDDLEMLKEKCTTLLEQKKEYWAKLGREIDWIHYPNSLSTSWLRDEIIPVIMLKAYGDLLLPHPKYDRFQLEYWDALDNMIKDLLALEEEALLEHSKKELINPFSNPFAQKVRSIKFENYYNETDSRNLL